MVDIVIDVRSFHKNIARYFLKKTVNLLQWLNCRNLYFFDLQKQIHLFQLVHHKMTIFRSKSTIVMFVCLFFVLVSKIAIIPYKMIIIEQCIKNRVHKYFVFARLIHIRSDSAKCCQFVINIVRRGYLSPLLPL